jgi:hypothetical protein
MAAIDQMKKLVDSLERAAQKAVDDHATQISFCIRRQLLEWRNRFPRHKFKAWEAHGLLVFEVDPPVMGEKYVSDLVMSRTGSAVLADLAVEAQQFQDLWNSQFTIGPMGDSSSWNL